MFRHHGSPIVCVVLLLVACGEDDTPRHTAAPASPEAGQQAPADEEATNTPAVTATTPAKATEAQEPVAKATEAQEPVAKATEAQATVAKATEAQATVAQTSEAAEPASTPEPAEAVPVQDAKAAIAGALAPGNGDTISVASAVHGAAPPPMPSADEAAKEEEAKGPLRVISGFDEPMAVLHEPGSDVYLVSNLNSRGPEDPGKGYISRVSPSGEIEGLKWIDGAAKRAKLRTPRGLATMGGRLYVADGSVIRVYDVRSGLSRGKVVIKGASRLNGLWASKGTLYVADVGFTEGGDPSGSDAVYQVNRAGHATALFRSSIVGPPSAVMRWDGVVWISTLGSGKLHGLDRRGRLVSGPPTFDGQLSGMTAIDSGEVVITSWAGDAVYRGTMSSAFKYLEGDIAQPGHPGWDASRRRVLVPSQRSGSIHVVSLDPPGAKKEKKKGQR